MKEKLINIDPEILSGTQVFFGTRVPVKNLFDYLESGFSLDDFHRNFPGVEKDIAARVLELAGKMLVSNQEYFGTENTL